MEICTHLQRSGFPDHGAAPGTSHPRKPIVAVGRLRPFSLALGIVVAFGACTPVTSDRPKQATGLAGEEGMKGVPYYLPQARIELQLLRKVVALPDATKTTTTTTRTEKKPASNQPASSTRSQVPAPAASPIADPPGTPQNYNSQPGVAMVAPNASSTNNTDADADAPTNLTTTVAERTRSTSVTVYQFKIVKTVLVPDSSQLFRLKYHPSALAKDDFKATVGTDGLLTNVTMSAEDKTGEIIIKLVQVATQLSQSLLLSEAPPVSDWTVVWDQTFNPFTDARAITNDLRRQFPDERFSVELLDEGQGADKAYQRAFDAKPQPEFSGVAFRPVLPYVLQCNRNKLVLNREVLLMPDPNKICTFPIQRSAFVKRVTDLTFDHGLLTTVNVTKDSEVLAFMEIPLAIAKAITDIPANLVQVRLNNTKNESAQTDAATALLQSQQKQIEAAQALKAARPPSNTTKGNFQ